MAVQCEHTYKPPGSGTQNSLTEARGCKAFSGNRISSGWVSTHTTPRCPGQWCHDQVRESEANLGMVKSHNNNNNVEILSCARGELPLSVIKYLQHV